MAQIQDSNSKIGGNSKPIAIKDFALENGFLLPHEILLKVANGEPISHRVMVECREKLGYGQGEVTGHEWSEPIEHYPTPSEQIEAAKAAAPYYAAKLSSQTIDGGDNITQSVKEAMKQLAAKLPG